MNKLMIFLLIFFAGCESYRKVDLNQINSAMGECLNFGGAKDVWIYKPHDKDDPKTRVGFVLCRNGARIDFDISGNKAISYRCGEKNCIKEVKRPLKYKAN